MDEVERLKRRVRWLEIQKGKLLDTIDGLHLQIRLSRAQAVGVGLASAVLMRIVLFAFPPSPKRPKRPKSAPDAATRPFFKASSRTLRTLWRGV